MGAVWGTHMLEGGVEVERAVEVVEHEPWMCVPLSVVLQQRFEGGNAT